MCWSGASGARCGDDRSTDDRLGETTERRIDVTFDPITFPLFLLGIIRWPLGVLGYYVGTFVRLFLENLLAAFGL
jgi:hypothetical protein